LRAIQQGDADMIIAGGAEASIFRQCLLDYFLLHPAAATMDSLTMESCRPFDARRKGFVPGEGAGMVVLECLEAARRRNAKIYGHLRGYGISNAGWQKDEMQQLASVARSMEKTLAVSGIEAAAVDYINANGDSTIRGDKLETMAIKKVFGDYAYLVPISSTKSMTGHLLSASGAVELVAALLAMQDNIIPPTINYRYPDAECDLDYVPNHCRKHGINVVLSNSISWFGLSASLVVQKFAA
jgi:3-oxoacyl-[acyl-carrier-protein] synthase II